MKEKLWIEMGLCEQALFQEIAEPKCTRTDVAKTYALALRSRDSKKIDWAKVNQAIIDRWSGSALNWIKRKAWDGSCYE